MRKILRSLVYPPGGGGGGPYPGLTLMWVFPLLHIHIYIHIYASERGASELGNFSKLF